MKLLRNIEFKAQVEKSLGKSILCFMSNNGGEYCSKEFDEFFRQQGIKHQKIVSHTPQQNGVVESSWNA